ncbi:MAG: hypothetical protein M3Q52_05665 [Pseudomonadota bacterium]|nr:hypothetical protein [Pseudomonadota bacterium]
MQQGSGTRTPAHLWIVGLLSLLWNAFGAYDYTMTRTRNMDYLSSMPGVDAEEMLAYIDGFPLWAEIGWGLGVWGAILGSILLLMRSRYAVWSFAVSLVGAAVSFAYQLTSTAPAGTEDGMMAFVPWIILAIALALFLYARAMRGQRVLR